MTAALSLALREPHPVFEPKRRPPVFPPPWAVAWGDDRFGLWADLEANGVIQRMRWMEPGEFWMGSPEKERGRLDREGPRHRVRLTAGYWLADTACTQALWLAVLGGKNPAHFSKDTQCPVEQVSWDDVQGFLEALGQNFTEGVQAVLPTEAQWEYACRAGTAWPFSFGESISTEQVNFSGQWSNDDKKATLGQARRRTVAVKSLPPNPWGLYEMHGNVWEWCADPMRAYVETSEGGVIENPGSAKPAPQAQESRAVRGGSWIGLARGARSAYRSADERGARMYALGFRLALRSTSTSPASAERPAQPPGRAEPGQDQQGIAPGQGPVPAKRRDAASPRAE